jgi:hypothetical protein
MTTDGGAWTECFSFTNTEEIELECTNDGWFDKCVDDTMAGWSGNEVMVKLLDQDGGEIYSAWGTRGSDWTYSNLTSTNPPPVPPCPSSNAQYDRETQHANAIVLDTGETLTISGKDAGQSGWGGSWGNGYVIVVQTTPAYAQNNVLTAMSFQHSGYCYYQCDSRAFSGMDPGHEVMYEPTGAISTHSNGSLQPEWKHLGKFVFLVR